MQDVNTLFFNNSKEPDAFEDGALDMELRIKTIATFARLTNVTCFVIDFDEHRMLYQTEKMLFLNEVSLMTFSANVKIHIGGWCEKTRSSICCT